MRYRVLYRIYRPRRFEDVVGQTYIVRTLKNSVINKKIANAYLFCGPRGTGKTSVAKIFASSVNCEHFKEDPCGECPNCLAAIEGNHPDIIEFDAASHSKVENIREILGQVSYTPGLGRYKVYIIDEVHMLSNAASNALLKTLEEPPAHVIFILATTDPQKVLPTIQSRCQRYDFAKIESPLLIGNMAAILDKENIPYEKEALEIIASLADGGMRDALSILEQCVAYGENGIHLQDVKEIYGLSTVSEQIALLEEAYCGQTQKMISRLRSMYESGVEINRLAADLLKAVKEALVYADTQDGKLLHVLTAKDAGELCRSTTRENLLFTGNVLLDMLSRKTQNIDSLSCFELALLRLKPTDTSRNSVFNTKEKLPEKKKDEGTQETKEETSVALILPDEVDTKESERRDIVKELDEIEEMEEYFAGVDDDYREDYPEFLEISYADLGRILLTASKEEKRKDEDILTEHLEEFAYEVNYRPYYTALKDARVLGSNKDFIIFMGNKPNSQRINEKEFNEELYFFLKDKLAIDKMVYIVALEDVNTKVTPAFLKAKEESPAPYEVKRYVRGTQHKEVSQEAEPSTEERLRDLFGEKVIMEDD